MIDFRLGIPMMAAGRLDCLYFAVVNPFLQRRVAKTEHVSRFTRGIEPRHKGSLSRGEYSRWKANCNS